MQQSAPILITGAGQRIGFYCASHFAEQGYPVIISYRRPNNNLHHLQALGVVCIQADFSSEQGILDFIAQVKEHTPSLRAIVHNASGWLDDSQQPMTELFNIHMLAPYLINLECEALLRKSPDADIIHITDDVTRKGSSKRIAYSATKAGLDNMTLSFASRFAPHIKVNSIAPALIMQHPHDDEVYLAQAKSKSVLHIIPGADSLYQAIHYLLDSPYTTGTTLVLNGGRHLK